jgi:hypothetical protein
MARGNKTSEVTRKFREPGIADRVLALLRYRDVKPENIAIALGINQVKNYRRQVEEAMDQLIEECDLPITKRVHGLKPDGSRTAETHVVYARQRQQKVPSTLANNAPTVTVKRDPKLATWTPQVAVERKLAERERKAAIYGEHSVQSAAVMGRHVAAVTSPQSEALTPSPSPSIGRGGQEGGGQEGAGETTDRQAIEEAEETQAEDKTAAVNADQARRAAAADKKLDRVLAELKESWPEYRLNLAQICRSGSFSNSFFASTKTSGKERKARALAAIEERKRILQQASDVSLPPMPEEPDAAPDPKRRIAELEAELAQLRAEKVQAAPVEADPREVLASRLPALEQRIANLNDQIDDLVRQREEVWGQRQALEKCLELL